MRLKSCLNIILPKNKFLYYIFYIAISLLLILALPYGCRKFEPERIIKIETVSISDVSYNSCSVKGTILDLSNKGINQHGFCWDIIHDPTIANNNIQLGSKIIKGTFTANLTDFSSSTTYYVRAYATNSEETAYGNEIMFRTSDALYDSRDGQYYLTIEIGTQMWMAEDLNFCSKSGSWYYENDSITYAELYGRLYTWETAKNVCPEEWHLPTDSEWKELEMYLGMTQEQSDSTGWRGTDQGVQLSIYGNSHFNGLLAGYRFYTGVFYDMSASAYYWSSTEASADFAWGRYISPNEISGINRTGLLKESGFSVRCIQDEK